MQQNNSLSDAKSTNTCWTGITLLTTLFWLSWLTKGTASHKPYYIAYLIVGFLSIYSVLALSEKPVTPPRYERTLLFVGSALFSSSVCLANYNIIPGLWGMLMYFSIGVIVSYPIFLFLFKKLCFSACAAQDHKQKPWIMFFVFAATIAAVDLFFLFTCYYPGILSPDSINQLQQIQTGSYSNHHPYYHTQLIHVIYNLGFIFFQDINKAVALYSVFQIICISSIFSYFLITMYQKNVPFKWISLCLLWYVLMPFNVMYSFTMWKDILWSGTGILIVTSLFRIFSRTGHMGLNYFIFTISSMVFCLFRSNAVFAFALFFLFLLLFFGTKHPKIALIMLGSLILAFVLKGPVLESLNVRQPDTIESLSIPAQQISRVIVDGHRLSPDQYELLSSVVDVEKIPETYKCYISDPIKNLVRATNNQAAITERKGDFFRLWVQLGISHPGTYLKAWIDQTKGYWNGGYNYWIWSYDVEENHLGVFHTVLVPKIQDCWKTYYNYFRDCFLSIFVSIGFHVWLTAGAAILALSRKDWVTVFLSTLSLATVASLLVATPVFSEFRYVYIVFVNLPVVILSLLTSVSKKPAV